jgi:hypothetical protein
MLWRRVWMRHADSAQVAMVDMGSGWADDASGLGSRPDKGRADVCEGTGLIWFEAASAKLRAWI